MVVLPFRLLAKQTIATWYLTTSKTVGITELYPALRGSIMLFLIYLSLLLPDGYLYFQEDGVDDGSTNPPSPISSYIESSAIDMGDGDQFMFVSRVLPDLTFRNSTSTPQATFEVSARDFPGASFDQTNSGAAVRLLQLP